MANFLFVLNRDNNEAATRCFQFAKIAHSKGHLTNVFLIDGGVNWADSGRDFICPTLLKTKYQSVSEFHVPKIVRLTRQNFFQI